MYCVRFVSVLSALQWDSSVKKKNQQKSSLRLIRNWIFIVDGSGMVVPTFISI